MQEMLILGGIVAGWIVLQRFILPSMGIET